MKEQNDIELAPSYFFNRKLFQETIRRLAETESYRAMAEKCHGTVSYATLWRWSQHDGAINLDMFLDGCSMLNLDPMEFFYEI